MPAVLPDARRVTGSYVQPPLDAAAARGVGLDALARAAGLPAGALSPLPESLGARDYIRLLGAGAQLADDPHFGLHVGELSLVDIAFLLGYQEQSAFTHAFKEWAGVNPGAWRDRVGPD